MGCWVWRMPQWQGIAATARRREEEGEVPALAIAAAKLNHGESHWQPLYAAATTPFKLIINQ